MNDNLSESSESKFNNAEVIAIVAYLAVIGWLIALILNNPRNEYASYHIRQALGVHLVFIASSVVMIVPLLGWLAGFFGFIIAAILWLLGIISAFKGEQRPVVLLGDYFQEWFQGL